MRDKFMAMLFNLLMIILSIIHDLTRLIFMIIFFIPMLFMKYDWYEKLIEVLSSNINEQ
jgi:hypothetical protein